MLSKKEGVRERDRLINELEDLQKRVTTQTKHIDELEEKHADDEEKIKDLYRQLEDLSNDSFKQKRAYEQISNKLQETSEERQYFGEEMKKYKQQVCKHVEHFVNKLVIFTILIQVGNWTSPCCSTKSANVGFESKFGQANDTKQPEQHETNEIDRFVKNALFKSHALFQQQHLCLQP